MSKDDEFDPSIPEDERRFYLKAYPDVAHVRERKVHCTICKMHIGTAPANESLIRMHPILRVTHCKKCHDFYNSGEFSKGEDGSELYCRWCGQGGEVYCCSNCPFVFCKSCIISNLSRGVVADIEQNENWSCFNCAPKMLWPLRAQHWALIKFIDKQKKAILNSTLSDAEIKQQMLKDRSLCCKIKKGSGYGTDSSDSSDISLSRLKKKAGEKRSRKSVSKEDLSGGASPAQSKKIKANDEVVCTPDVMSMLEPECTLTVPASVKVQPTNPQPSTPTPKILSIQPPAKRITPPPLQFRNAGLPALRPAAPPTQILKKTVVGQRMPVSGQGSDYTTPVYHTINGYRIDLNSAAQQETVRLPNGKLIQVKRQGTGPQQIANAQSSPNQHSTPTRVIHNISTPTNVVPIAPQQQIVHSSGGHIIRAQLQSPRPVSIQNTGIVGQYQQPSPQPTTVQPQYQQITIRQPNQQIATIRYQSNATPQVTNMIPNGGTMQILNGTPQVTSTGATNQVAALRQVPTFIKQLFPNTPLGQSRTQLQNQIFSAMEICQHLMGKLHTLTNSNAYKTAKSMTDVKELYIHLSYLLTYAIGRFKGLQDNCLADMRDLGFTNDANSLENGQLAAGMDMVRTGVIKDFASIDLESFHSLIVKNLNITKQEAVADSSITTSTNCATPEQPKPKAEKKLTPLNYNRMIIGQNGHSTPGDLEKDSNSNSNDNENDEDNECLLVEESPAQIVELESESEAEEDCLLVELADRISDRYTPSPAPSSDNDEVHEGFDSGLLTAYEFDKDYDGYASDERRNNYYNLSSNFTEAQDIQLIQILRKYPLLWYPKRTKTTTITQNILWKEIRKEMPKKQASDAEEDEITIVEPQTDTINLDSDNEDDQPAPTNKPNGNASVQPAVRSNSNINQNQQMIRMQPEEQQMPIVTPTTTTNADDEITAEYDFSKVASLLAGMLEVELTEGGTECVQQPKKPRKKTTHKPNPTLVKQKEMQERERLENIKKNCAKLKMEVEIPLNKVEEIYKFAKPMLDELIEENLRKKEEGDVLDQEIESKKTEVIEDAEKAEPNENDISKESVQSEKETENETHDDSEEIVVVLMEEGEETDKATTEKKTEGEAEADRELETEMEPKPAEAEIDGEAEAGTAEAQVEVDAEAKVTDKAAITDDGDEAKTNKIDDEKEEDSSNLTTDEANKEKAITAESKDDEEENKTADESDFPEPELFTVDDIEAVEDQEMSGDSEKTKSSELPLKSNEVEQKMDIDSDPPQSDEKVVVPNEVLTPTKEDKRDVDENNLDSSSLSHNFNALLGQTEVA